jgi:hypothetical protein
VPIRRSLLRERTTEINKGTKTPDCAGMFSRGMGESFGFQLAGGLGFEPRFSESESDVLPLNYPPAKGLKSLGFCPMVLQITQNHGNRFCKCAPDIGGAAFAVQPHVMILNLARPAAATCISGHRNRM